MRRALLLAIPAAAVAGGFALDLGRYLSLEALQQQREALLEWRDIDPLLVSAAYFAAYVLATAWPIPGAAVLTLMEANPFAAGEWHKAHKPEGLLRWAERMHDWRRGDGRRG